MEYRIYQNKLSQLSARFNLMVCLVFGLLLSNVLLAAFVWEVWWHKQIEITPFFGGDTYVKRDTAVDSKYISLMAENFIYSRLNVTPETVGVNHKRLLQFVDAQSYAVMLKVLTNEANVIRSKKISSLFNITNIQINPHECSAKVQGILQRYVGIRALRQERITYNLRFRYHLGRLAMLSFSKEPAHE